MMKTQLSHNIKNYVLAFAKLYQRYHVESERLRSFRYQISSTLEEYKRTLKIELSLTDRPGDILPPMSVEQVKNAPDIISHMHPLDVNSINDLYYLSKDKVVEVNIFGEKIITTTQTGKITEYDINDSIELEKMDSTRVSYIIGHMQAEKLIRQTYQESERYKITKDNITSLLIYDFKKNEQFLRKPNDILFSGEYKMYSKDDIAKIGYICGQMVNIN